MRNKSILLLLCLIFVSANSFAQSFLTGGLVAYYPFDGNANDATGHGNNGYMTGTVGTTNRFGLPNSALYFNGTNSTVAISNQFLNIGADYSISMWFCTFDSSVPFQQLVNSRPNPAIDLGYNVPLNSANLYLELSIGTGTDWLQPTQQHGPKNDYLSHQWYQAIVVKSGANYSTFVNGVLDASFSRSPGPTLVGLQIGSNARNSGDAFYQDWYGILDDVRVYNRALDLTEVQQLHVYESGPQVALINAVKPSFFNLTISTNYQLQVSTDLNSWTNQGGIFTATNTSMVYPQYFDVGNWNQLFFRLQVTP